MTRRTLAISSTLALLLFTACSGDGSPEADSGGDSSSDEAGELTPFQEEHGIGPFTEEVQLGPEVDEELARSGQETFEFSCEACHSLSESFVGPALGDVLERRSPTFVMNMIMNPAEMAERHPVTRELLREYPVVMPYQNISEDEARAIVEYLRTIDP